MKTVVITGAAGGMGVALCHRLAKAGINLALCSHSAERLEALAKDLTATYGIKVTYAAFEIYEEAAVKAFFDSAAAELGNFDALVNLAGLSIPTKMETVTEEDFDRMIDVNVKGTLFASKHYALHANEEGGLIINVGSMAARRANGNAPLYCTAKSALNMMASAMQIQLAQRNIRVSTPQSRRRRYALLGNPSGRPFQVPQRRRCGGRHRVHSQPSPYGHPLCGLRVCRHRSCHQVS